MRKIAYIPLTKAPERFVDFSAYRDLFGYDSSYQFYGAFYKGQQVGYGAAKDGQIVHVSSVDPEVDYGMMSFMAKYIGPDYIQKHAYVRESGMTDSQLQQMAQGFPDRSRIVHQFDDGWTMREPQFYGDLQREGQLMSNCFNPTNRRGAHPVWSFHPQAQNIADPEQMAKNYDPHTWNTHPIYREGQTPGIYSLRDPNNIPHVTVDYSNLYALHPNDTSLGRHNSPVKEQYIPYLNQWHQERQGEPWDDDWEDNMMYASKAKGKDPKDKINAPIPFIYDVHKKHIQIGYEGEHCRDIKPYRGEFSKGGIVEGEYGPGGKMIIFPSNSALYTTKNITNTWAQQFPQMEITSLEMERDGDTHKIAAQMDPGQYIRVLTSADPAASKAYEALKFAGGKVYVVGGAVRDVLRGEEPNDIDMMVAGIPPEEVNNILSKLPGHVDLTGKRFGVYRYNFDGHEVEIALPRQDKYETAQRGKGIITVDHQLPLEKDLERRDFTANSIAVDLDTGELHDPYGGQQDIEENVLRTTHPDSFREDPTRLVRALAAHSRFGLHPNKTTRDEMAASAHLLRGESPDTLNGQLDKLFKSPNPAAAMRLGHETGVLKHLYPELDDNWDFDQKNPHHEHTLGEHSMQVLDTASELTHDPDVRQAAMLHDIGKPNSQWIDDNGVGHYYQSYNSHGVIGGDHEKVGAQMANDLLRKRFNYPVARINRMTHLINHHMFPQFNSQKGARKFLNRVGDQHADDLLHIREADMGGKGVETPGDQPVQQMRTIVDEVRKNQQPTDLNNLAINGNDLIQLGVPQGPQVGQILRNLLDHVIDIPTDNNPAKLMELTKGYIR